MERGGCSFVKKVRNIEHAGGHAGIVVDTKFEDVQYVIMSDDGTGSGIRIPSMLIGKNDGQKIISFMKKYGGSKSTGGSDDPEFDDVEGDDVKPNLSKKEQENQEILESTQVMITFNMDKPDNRVEYDIWFTSTDDRALDFIDNFRAFDDLFGDKVLMTPHFVTFDCQGCDRDYKENECFGDGKYCAINHDNTKLSGHEIILEDIRQKCIYNNSMSENDNAVNFWDYIKRAHAFCPDYINEDCSRNTHKDLSLSWEETMACVDDSFDRRN